MSSSSSSGTPQEPRAFKLPPVPSFRGGRLDTPAESWTKSRPKKILSPERRQSENLQHRLKLAALEKEQQIQNIEGIIDGKGSLAVAEQERIVSSAIHGSIGLHLRKRAQFWTCLSKLALEQQCRERAIAYLQQALVFKAQPTEAIKAALQSIYIECGGTSDDLLTPPADWNSHNDHDSMVISPVLTPITKRLKAKLFNNEDPGDDALQPMQFGTPRAAKLSLLKTDSVKPFVESDTPSPESVPVVRLAEMLERAYIDAPPLVIPAKKAPGPTPNPFQNPSPSVPRPSSIHLGNNRLSPDNAVLKSSKVELPSETEFTKIAASMDDEYDEHTFSEDIDEVLEDVSAVASAPSKAFGESGCSASTVVHVKLEKHGAYSDSTASKATEKKTGTVVVLDKVGGSPSRSRPATATPVRRTFRRIDRPQTDDEATDILEECQYKFKPNPHLKPLVSKSCPDTNVNCKPAEQSIPSKTKGQQQAPVRQSQRLKRNL